MYPFNGHSIATPHNRPVHCPQGVPHVITGIIPFQRRPQQLLEPDGRGPAESGRRRTTLGAGATSGGSPCPVRSGSGRISSTQPWSTRCLHEVLSNVSSPWEIRQTLHSCSGRTVGKRSGNGAGCQSDGRGPAESGRRTTLGAGATFGGSPCPVRSGSDIFDSTLVDPVPPRESQYRQQPVEDPPDAPQIHQAHCRETVGKLSWLPV